MKYVFALTVACCLAVAAVGYRLATRVPTPEETAPIIAALNAERASRPADGGSR